MKEFPKLYKKTSTGAIQEWEVSVAIIDGDATKINKYGQVDGKIQTSTEKILEGKNIGRSNETTPIQQAEMDAESDWKKQLKKGYVQSIEDAKEGKLDECIQGGIFPMLAHKYSEQAKKIKLPAIAQPKLDGHRCTSQDVGSVVTLWSRKRQPITSMQHITDAIGKSPIIYGETCITRLDGELYNHEYHDKFQQLSSFIRNEEPQEGSEVVQYHVYDFPHPCLTNRERNEILQKLKPAFEGTPIHIVESIIVNDEAELMEAFEHFLAEGYEGAIVRNMDGLYVNKRSYDLQKIKEFDDAEFKIIGIKIGTKGSMAGKAIFICDIPAIHGKVKDPTFDVVMKGTMAERQMYADNQELVIGKILTVQFQGYTDEGKPRFPVGLRFREDI